WDVEEKLLPRLLRTTSAIGAAVVADDEAAPVPARRDARAETDRGADFVQSLERGFAVIRSFAGERTALTLSEVATATGLTRAAARRFLLTLAELGYVAADGRSFRLTPRVLELGRGY